MELIQLLSFHQIVVTQSFTEAAKKVFRSQSAISHQIRNLEKELEVKLFERIGKKIKLTSQGEILFDLTDKMFEDLENLKTIFLDMEEGIAGKLVIATSSAVMTHVLPGVIKRFKNKFPKINFKFITCNFISDILSLILEGEVDFGIGIKTYEVLPQKIAFLKWKSFDTFLITSKGHPLSKEGTVKLVDIAKYPHILYRRGTVLRKVVDEIYAQNKINYNVLIEMDMAENIKIYVEKGIGVGILSSIAITNKDRKRFAIFNVSSYFGKVDVGIYYRKDKYISSAMRQFIKLFAADLLNNFDQIQNICFKDMPLRNR